MVSLLVSPTGYSLAFSSLADRDAFARCVGRTRLRIRWTGPTDCTLCPSAVSKVLLLLAQDGAAIVEVVVAADCDADVGRDQPLPPDRDSQLTLW